MQIKIQKYYLVVCMTSNFDQVNVIYIMYMAALENVIIN